MTKKKDMFSLHIDYDQVKQVRLRTICAFLGGKSIRSFVAEALDNEIDYRLKKMSASELEVFENIVKKAITSSTL